MGARLLNSCQIEIFEARQNSLLLLHDIPWQAAYLPKPFLGMEWKQAAASNKKVAIKKHHYMKASHLPLKLKLEFFLQILL